MKKLFFAFAAFTVLASCAKKEIAPEVVDPTSERHEVSFVARAAETKTQLTGNDVVWETADVIRMKFTKETAVYTEDFTLQGEGGTVSATFKGTLPIEVATANGYVDDVYAVYPSSAMDQATGNVAFALEAAQQVAPGSFPSGMNLTSTKVSLDELNISAVEDAQFKNAFSIIRFSLPENVKSVKITGTANLAGNAAFDFNEEGRLVAESWNSESKSIVVTPKDAECFTAGEEYNILVYPGEHSSLSVELTDADNCKYSNTRTETFAFLASKYYSFSFRDEFTQDFTFNVEGLADGWSVMAVFENGEAEDAYEAVVNNGSFTLSLPHSENTLSGYVLYPSSAYESGKIIYNLDPFSPDAHTLMWGILSTDNPDVSVQRFGSQGISKLTYTLPSGVECVEFRCTEPFCGKAELKMENGQLQFDKPANEGVALTGSISSGTMYVFPLTDATLTFKFKNAAGQVYSHVVSNVTVALGGTKHIDLPETIDFDKNGIFDNEGFESGGDNIEF